MIGAHVTHRVHGEGKVWGDLGAGEVVIRFADGAKRRYLLATALLSGALVMQDQSTPPPTTPEPETKVPPAPSQVPSANHQEPAMPKPHQMIPRLLAACAQRKILRAEAIRQMGISTGSWHQMQTRGVAGEKLLAKCEAWLVASAPAEPVTSAPRRKTKEKREPAECSRPLRAQPQVASPVQGRQLLRQMAEALGLPVTEACIAEHGELIKRDVVVL